MSDVPDKFRFKLQPTRPDQLPDTVSVYLAGHHGSDPSVIVPSAEGWRHGLPDVDLNDEAVRRASSHLTERSLKRISSEKMSPGEASILDADIEYEI